MFTPEQSRVIAQALNTQAFMNYISTHGIDPAIKIRDEIVSMDIGNVTFSSLSDTAKSVLTDALNELDTTPQALNLM